MTGWELLKALRDLGMTQRRFAEKIGYREETVSRWVRERDAIPPVVVIAVNGMLNEPQPPEAA